MASQDWFEKDFYKVLGVSPDADEKEIKKTYRKAARKYHPDNHPGDAGAEQRFKEIGEAYAVLSDPEQRQQYDAIRAMSRGGARFTAGGPGGAGGAGGFEDVFSTLFGGGAGGPGGRFTYTTGGQGGNPFGARTGGPGAEQINIEDLLGMFGQGGGGGRGGGYPGGDPFGGGFGGGRAPSKGQDVEATATLTFRQAVEGTLVEVHGPDGKPSKVRIKPGIRDGGTVRIPGKGHPGHGGPNGDMLVHVSVMPDDVFGRDGDNLTVDVPVTFAEAALGGTISVPTYGGEPVKVRLAAGTPSGRTLRVKGRGIAKADGHKGDLLVKVQVVVPQRLTDEAKEAVKVLADLDAGHDPRADLFRRARTG